MTQEINKCQKRIGNIVCVVTSHRLTISSSAVVLSKTKRWFWGHVLGGGGMIFPSTCVIVA